MLASAPFGPVRSAAVTWWLKTLEPRPSVKVSPTWNTPASAKLRIGLKAPPIRVTSESVPLTVSVPLLASRSNCTSSGSTPLPKAALPNWKPSTLGSSVGGSDTVGPDKLGPW